MALTTKEQVLEVAAQLRNAAKVQDPAAGAAVKLIQLSYEVAKESLVSATGEDMYRRQGEAQALARILKELTQNPPTQRPQQEQ